MSDKDQPMIEVSHDGQTISVPLPDGFVPVESLTETHMPKAAFEQQLNRRVNSVIKNKGLVERDALFEDEAFRGEFVTRHELVAKEDLDAATAKGAELQAERIRGLKDGWVTSELKPVKEQLEKSQSRINSLLSKSRNAEILQAGAAAGIDPVLLTPPTPDSEPPLVSMLGSVFGYDEEYDRHFVVSGEGFAPSPSVRDNVAFMGVTEFIEQWASKPANAHFIDKNKQSSANLGDADTKASGKNVILTKEQASDNPTYVRAKKRAEELGGRVIVQ